VSLQIIDVDQHLFESRTTWSDCIDPARKADALTLRHGAPFHKLSDRAVAGLAEPARSNMLGANAAWLLGL
jgi:hypothetical protein